MVCSQEEQLNLSHKEENQLRILITGADGQVGKALYKKLIGLDVDALGKSDLDITKEDQVRTFFQNKKPDVVFHCAAFTQVDQCENDKKKAFEVNAISSGILAQSCENSGAKLIYYSSDYVFNGKKKTPYLESDQSEPLSTYGMSKWIGERLVQQLSPSSTIIRTSWVFGHGGKNFVTTMLELAKQQKIVRVIEDQVGSPTYADDLAEYSVNMINHPKGVYHITNSGSCSWYDFAKRIFKEGGYDPSLVHPVQSDQYGSLAKRPENSVLSHRNLMKLGLQPPRKWEDALKEYIRRELSDD